MKPPRKRRPLTFTEPDTSFDIPAVEETAVEAADAPEPSQSGAELAARPLSERARRRLAEAEQQAAVETPVEMAVSADAPPVAYQQRPLTPSRRKSAPAKDARHAYLIAGVASLLWIGGVAALLASETGFNLAQLEPLRLAIYGLIALAPAGLAIMLAHSARQGAGLAAETRRARELSEAMLAPTALAARDTGEVLNVLRNDIDQATLAAERARNDMVLLREALSEETNRLNQAAETAGATARRLAEQLGAEHERLTSLGSQLDTQAAGVLEAVERQSRMVVDASDLAQTQLREAESALASRSTELAAAATEAQNAARVAADDLSRQTLRLENAGTGVAEQIQSVEDGLGQQRAALVSAAYALRTDQEDFSAQVESQRAQLTEQLSSTRDASTALSETTTRTSEAVKDIVDAAGDQLRALMDMSNREAENFDAATKVALDKFETLAAEARDALMEETRRAVEVLQATAGQVRDASGEAVQAAQARAAQLGEAASQAAFSAEEAADARVASARKVVDDTASLIDQAGEQAAERLEVTVERVNATLARIEESIRDLDARTAQMPDEAHRRIEAVKASVEGGLSALTAAAQRAAADTAELEADFQERIRRNYEMLTEAVRLMGVVSGDASRSARRDPSAAPTPAPEAPAKPNLRGRLQLEAVDPPVAPPTVGSGWRGLVRQSPPTGEDVPVMPAPGDDDGLAERVVAAVRRMGVDPNALLPRARVDEAALAMAGQNPDQARQIVRRVAPAAVRSVSRRVLTDAELRADAEAYVRMFGAELAALAREGDGWRLAERLTTDGGRTFMLLDAAIGDLA